MRTCRYVERNALRAGLVRRAQDWPWCSLADRLRPEPRLPLVSTPFLVSDAWIEYVNAPIMLSEQSEKRVPLKRKTVENRHDPYTPPITQA
jgi:putative transposase